MGFLLEEQLDAQEDGQEEPNGFYRKGTFPMIDSPAFSGGF